MYHMIWNVKSLRFSHIIHLCAVYVSQNKKRLFPWTGLKDRSSLLVKILVYWAGTYLYASFTTKERTKWPCRWIRSSNFFVAKNCWRIYFINGTTLNNFLMYLIYCSIYVSEIRQEKFSCSYYAIQICSRTDRQQSVVCVNPRADIPYTVCQTLTLLKLNIHSPVSKWSQLMNLRQIRLQVQDYQLRSNIILH